MASNLIIQIVASESTPEKEKEYDDWYTNKHVPMLFEYKGMKAASRYRLKGDAEGAARYLTFYEFESEEAQKAFMDSPAFNAAIEDFEKTKDKVEIQIKWAAGYELIRAWER
jgi:uncharacterized protein (TIGR02118 family)